MNLLIIIILCFVVVVNLGGWKAAFGVHSVNAFPPGGTYLESKAVFLESTASNSTIYYSTDGTDPTNSSLQYSGPITIDTSTSLKFMAVDQANNHMSSIVTENYIIDTQIPTVIATSPEANSTRVDTLDTSIINATFSEAMNASTINQETFTIYFSGNPLNSISGTVQYDPLYNTASFVLDSSLAVGTLYTVTLNHNIKDNAGNSLAEDYVWNFTTGGQFTIVLLDLDATEPPGLNGSAFTITPDPFTLEGSLIVADNDEFDSDYIVFSERIDGVITLRNVQFSSYVLTETIVPNGFAKVYDNVILTVHETKPDSIVFIRNADTSIQLQEIVNPIEVPAPDLNTTQFEIYKGKAFKGEFSGRFGDIPIGASEIFNVGPDAVPFASIATSEEALDELLAHAPLALIFTETAPATASAQEIFSLFQIPTYPDPEQSIADDITYFVPSYVIPYDDSENNFIVTPVIGKVYAGMTLLMNQSSFVESELAEVKRFSMTFNSEGNNVGFSFGISDTPPPGTPPPPFDVPALFLDIGFIGDVDFSSPSAFQSSPEIDILVNKTLPGFPELPNGCPDFKLLFFDGTDWSEVQKLEPTGNFTDACPFTLEPEHFSKFGVGGVIPDVIATEGPPKERHHGGGGGGGSTSVEQMISGNNVESETSVGSDSVFILFDTVESGSGQLKISTEDISKSAGMFDQIVSQQGKERGMVELDGSTFSTSGKIFDIDASAVKFQGMVKVTIPYDEQIAQSSSSESNVRFLHYNEQKKHWEDATVAFDAEKTTVTGMMDSLSPVIAAIVNDGTYGSTYFEKNPLSRIIITNDHSNVIENGSTGERLSIPLTIRNLQRADQQYSVLIQILDEENIARYIGWQEGSLTRAQSTDISFTWQSVQEGHFKVQIFVWNNLDHSSPLSQASVLEIAARH